MLFAARKRYVSVDYIKGIAMMMVIMVHYGQNFQIAIAKICKYMQMGCPMFFVASGFGIMCLINNRYGGMDLENVKKFYISRFKALAPGWYVTFIFIYLINTGMLYFMGQTLSIGSNRECISIICNLFFLNGLIPFCNNNVMPGGWYIGTTVILYTLTPIIFKGLNITKNKRGFFAVSSMLGLLLWGGGYHFFHDSFSKDGFGYFFFLIHYPEYLLGMLLYYDLRSEVFSAKNIRLCLLCGIVSLILAVVFFYISIPFNGYFSAWMTALATYFLLYYMISNEKWENTQRNSLDVLAAFGRNSYCIFLLHSLVVWPLTSLLLKILEAINIPQVILFFMMIPVVMFFSYILGRILQNVVKGITNVFEGFDLKKCYR